MLQQQLCPIYYLIDMHFKTGGSVIEHCPSLPHLKQFHTRLKQCALGFTGHGSNRHSFLFTIKETQDGQRQSRPIAEKIIYTFDALPTETN